MRPKRTLILVMMVLAAASASSAKNDLEAIAGQVRAAERAFAKTMAERDLAAFGAFVSEDALFLGGESVLRGRAQVMEGWKRFFEGPAAPFSWQPEEVEVLASGMLAISSGPVNDPQGKRIGTFNSIWRREKGGRWKVLIDKGCPPCE